jgi:hypothetical protein
MRNALSHDRSISPLKGNSKSIAKKSLNDLRRGPRKLTIADMGGDTMDELTETVTNGTSSFQDQGGEGGGLHGRQLSILSDLLGFTQPSCAQRARGTSGIHG